MKGLGIAWSIFIATGVLAFTATALFHIHKMISEARVFQRLNVTSISLSGASFDGGSGKLSNVTFCVYLKNDSTRPIFFRIRRESHSLEGRINQDAVTDPSVLLVPANAPHGIILATIGDEISVARGGVGPKGEIDIEIEYGPRRNALFYVYRYVTDAQIAIDLDNVGNARYTTLSQVVDLSHRQNTGRRLRPNEPGIRLYI